MLKVLQHMRPELPLCDVRTARGWPSANQKEVPHQRTKLVGTLVLDFPTSRIAEKKKNSYCLSHLVYGILLWELEQTNTETKAQRRQTLKLHREPSCVILPSCGKVDIFSVVFPSLLFYSPVLTLQV